MAVGADRELSPYFPIHNAHEAGLIGDDKDRAIWVHLRGQTHWANLKDFRERARQPQKE
ncbi:hypothetical protein GCM10011577_39770 [Pseudarthrobacter polychromogenes]|uniref:Uncharacterized protein n=1 Tax=Pseudarthrobacter polychromogenes TaxID=1676 RepID=A0ABQ1Y3L5_9MICC|nr:hypothetical protein GCM10011577_39770 [Pseudarthrobacter polychromogenes]